MIKTFIKTKDFSHLVTEAALLSTKGIDPSFESGLYNRYVNIVSKGRASGKNIYIAYTNKSYSLILK